MEELTKRNGKGVWMREIEKVLKRFDASLEWLMERIGVRDEEIQRMTPNDEMEARENDGIMRTKRNTSIAEVLEEVEVLIDTRFFDEFSRTKSSMCLKRAITNQSEIEMRLFKKTWRTLNCSPDTMKVIGEMLENLHCVGKRNRLVMKKAETKCWCSKAGQTLNAKHIIGYCRKASGEINARHDTVVNVLLNNILRKRGLVVHERKWEEWEMVRTAQIRSPSGQNTGGLKRGKAKGVSWE